MEFNAADLYPEVALTQAEASAFASALYAIAHSDGLHEKEEALIRSFYESVTGDAAGTLTALDPHALAAAIPREDQRQVFILTAWLMAFADLHVSDAEEDAIRHYGAALQMEPLQMRHLRDRVLSYLEQQRV